uniref:G_PROTEIN_RECEP_F1_2 domain-containing protein n=1 Tax=Rhabditophanes sp. KR3021 TaxID=114890 RepID=A0AC35TK86_9BILA
MNEEVYNKFVIIASSIAIVMNLFSVYVIKFKGPKKEEIFTKYLIWGRLGDAFFAFISGIFLTIKVTLSHILVISNGICHKLSGPYLCNFFVMLWILSIGINYCVIGFPFFAMRNVFVLKKEAGYLSIFEKFLFVYCHVATPITTLSISHLFIVPSKEIESLLKNESVLMEFVNNPDYSVFMYDTRLTSVLMCTAYVLIFNYTFLLWYGHLVNYMPLRRELIKSKKEARLETVSMIEKALVKIATIYLIPMFVALFPFSFAFIGLNIFRIPVSKEVERWVGASVVIGPILYYILSPIVTIYTMRKDKGSGNNTVAVRPLNNR